MMLKCPLRSDLIVCSMLLIIVMCFLRGVCGVCPDNPDRSTTYVPIAESDYDRNYSSITSEGKQPLGFTKAMWQFNNPENSSCISVVAGTQRRSLEIKFESIPASRLCVKLQGKDMGCSDQGTGRLFLCVPISTNKVYVEFTCDSQCSENDVQFWYRLVLGDTAEQDPEGNVWCDNRDRDEYPQSLYQLPQDYPMNIQTPAPKGVAFRISGSSYFFIVFVLFIMEQIVD